MQDTACSKETLQLFIELCHKLEVWAIQRSKEFLENGVLIFSPSFETTMKLFKETHLKGGRDPKTMSVIQYDFCYGYTLCEGLKSLCLSASMTKVNHYRDGFDDRHKLPNMTKTPMVLETAVRYLDGLKSWLFEISLCTQRVARFFADSYFEMNPILFPLVHFNRFAQAIVKDFMGVSEMSIENIPRIDSDIPCIDNGRKADKIIRNIERPREMLFHLWDDIKCLFAVEGVQDCELITKACEGQDPYELESVPVDTVSTLFRYMETMAQVQAELRIRSTSVPALENNPQENAAAAAAATAMTPVSDTQGENKENEGRLSKAKKRVIMATPNPPKTRRLMVEFESPDALKQEEKGEQKVKHEEEEEEEQVKVKDEPSSDSKLYS